MYMYMYIYCNIHFRTYCTCTHVHVYTYVHCTCVHVHVQYMHTHMHIYMYMYICCTLKLMISLPLSNGFLWCGIPSLRTTLTSSKTSSMFMYFITYIKLAIENNRHVPCFMTSPGCEVITSCLLSRVVITLRKPQRASDKSICCGIKSAN